MLIGDTQVAVEEAILTFILIAVLTFNTLLFRQGSGDYSIKYKLMERHKFFRQNQCALMTIQYLYKGFFILPFILLIAITIIQSIKNILNLPTILINGLIILLILYPTKKQHFYIRMAGIWLLTFGSQLSTLFIFLTQSEQIYYILSVIFYTGNILFFFLSLLAIEGVYWEISEAILKFKDQVKDVNQEWVKGRQCIPFIFHGGIYGLFCNASIHNSQNRKSYLTYGILYLISLIFLGVYAYLVYAYTGLYLGIVGLVANIIYDIFIKIFARLQIQGRSLTTIFIVLVAGRVLSFCFGSTLWLLGYCILYFGVSIFVGWMIINHRLPLKDPEVKPVKQNALKSTQFVLLILSVQIVVMIVSEVYGVKTSDNVEYNDVSIPIWQWAILALIAAWVVIIYLVSVRIFLRHRYKIHGLHQYYFGTQTITEEHLYKFLSYLLLIALGLYSYLYLNDKVILTGCIFIPLIFLCLQSLGVAWTNNQYQILADIEDYNKIQKKKFEAHKKRQSMIQNNAKLKQMKSKMMMTKVQNKDQDDGFFRSFKDLQKLKFASSGQEHMKQGQAQEVEKTTHHLKFIIGEQDPDPNAHSNQYIPLRNWRDPDQNIQGLMQILSNLTPSDRTIIRLMFVMVLLLVGYCCMCSLWANSNFAISFTVCLICYLSLSPYYRCYKRKYQILAGQLIAVIAGFLLGVAYWSVYNTQVIGPLAYSFIYLLLASILMYGVFANSLSKLIQISLGIVIGLKAIFILVTLGIQTETIYVTIFSLIFFIIALGLVILYFYLRDNYVQKKVIITCSVLVFIASVALAVIGYILQVLSSFAVFTISLVLIYLSFLLSSIGLALTAHSKIEQNPIVYSSYGIPHYKFDSSKEKLKQNSTYMVLFSFSSITLVIYAGVVSVFFTDKFYAVGVLAYLQLTNTFVEIMTSISSYYFLGRYKQYLSDQIILKALNKLKKDYMAEQTQGEDSPYYKLEYQKAHAEASDTGGNENWKKVVKYKTLYIKNLKQEQKFLFFWIALIQFYAVASRKQQMTSVLVQLKQIQQQLNDSGIFLAQLGTKLDYKQKYKRVMTQINSLQPFNYMIYEEILTQHRAQAKLNEQKAEQLDQRNQVEHKERDEDIYKNIKSVGNPNEQIQKFQQLLKDLGRKNLFTDEEFPANQNSLDWLSSQVDKWRRPNFGQVLAKGTMSADDVKQGNIGDCYLISSFGVLGDTKIKQALGIGSDGNQRWNNSKGAYMVRFYKFSKEVFVIIDDQIPVNQQDDWVFARSEDPHQFWPCILQKAYAKLYSGYHNIVSGKCHRVLSQFTGGFPFQILLKEYKSNPNGLWTQILNSRKNGYLMGAGTPSNPDGDRAFSKRGIVQGHAYSILDAKQVDEYRLIKLKNPHGSAGRQWIGDFADNSDLMTKRMLQILDHKVSDDGFFWMTLSDFIHQFKSLYICAVFDPSKWKRIGPINGNWSIQNSNGLPNIPGCEINPHYGIKVTKACSIFISLTQEAKSALKGQNFIYMRVQKNDGKRMKQQNICSQDLLGKQGPKDAVTISCQIALQAPQYPYIFSLMVCTGKPGNTGSYTLQFYSQDQEFQIILDQNFDLQSKQ